MSVHYDISKKVNEKLKAIEKYKQFDIEREIYIDKAVETYQSSNTIDLNNLNKLTCEMNQLAIKYQLPPRKIITVEMFLKYAKKQLK